MPGIAGIITAHCADKRLRIGRQMVQSMVHEPWHVADAVQFESLGLFAGCVSNDSAEDFGPVWNSTREICLILTGELFHEAGSARRDFLRAAIDLYQKRGPEFVAMLNGWFAGLLVDFRSKSLFLFNDRYGMSRVYIHEAAEDLFFASEAKCLLKALPELRSLNEQSLAEWLTCGCVLEGRTLFPKISLLPPASLWRIWPDGRIDKQSYFNPREWEEQSPLDAETYYSELQDCFSRIVPRYFGGSQRVGISLTGGVDSRLVMAWRPPPARSVPCYSFGGPFRDCYDVKLGRRVAEACQQPHQVIRVDDRFLQEFPELAAKAACVSDGAMDATGSVELYVNAAAREIAPVRLTGNYGGEVLRSLVAFRPHPIIPLPFAPELRPSFSAVAETYQAQRQCHPVSFIAFKQVPWYHHSRLSVEQSQVVVRSPFLDNELVKHVYRAPSRGANGKDISLRLIRDGNPALALIPTDRGLRANDVPVLSAAYRQWLSFTVKAEYAFDYGMPQWLTGINRMMEPLKLERAVLGWNKFYHFRHWYRHSLGGFLRDVLLSSAALQRSHFDSAGLRKLVSAHVEGRGNYTVELNRILALELMQRQLLDSSAGDHVSVPRIRRSTAANGHMAADVV